MLHASLKLKPPPQRLKFIIQLGSLLRFSITLTKKSNEQVRKNKLHPNHVRDKVVKNQNWALLIGI